MPLDLEVLDRITDGVFVLDRDWTCVFMNEAGGRLVGHHPADLIGRNIWEAFPDAVGSIFEQRYRWALDHQEVVEFEEYFVPLDKWLSVRVFPCPDGLTITYQDSSVRRFAEDALRQSVVHAQTAQTSYQDLLDSMAEGVTESSVSGEILAVNRAFAVLLGYESADELMASVANAADLYVNPRQRSSAVRRVTGESPEVIEAEMRRRDGSSIWVRARAIAQRSATGEVIRLRGIIEDITADREAAQRLREAAELVELAFHKNPMPLFTLDVGPPGRAAIVEANRAAEALLGYGPGELIGMDPAEFVDPEDLPGELASLADALSGTIPSAAFETRRRHRDGHMIPVAVTAATFTNRNGRPYIVAALEEITARRAAEAALVRSFDHTVAAIAHLVEVRDPYTAGHQLRVAELAKAMAVRLGLGHDEARGIWIAATIHDIGKIAIPSDILTKPAKLSPPEFEIIKTHPQVGFDIVKAIEFPWPVAKMILQHHERLDGSGYPHGLRGDQIGRGSRILMIADTVEAMTHFRPYRPGLGLHVALDEILQGRGTRYEAEAVDACLAVFDTGELDWTGEAGGNAA